MYLIFIGVHGTLDFAAYDVSAVYCSLAVSAGQTEDFHYV